MSNRACAFLYIGALQAWDGGCHVLVFNLKQILILLNNSAAHVKFSVVQRIEVLKD